jgi:hypothetical protein
MSRMDRLKEYSKPLAGQFHGAASDKGNLDAWSERAHEHSKCAPRSRDGEVKLPSTKQVDVRSTASKPFVGRKIDKQMAGDGDLNHAGDSTYLRGVRREA